MPPDYPPQPQPPVQQPVPPATPGHPQNYDFIMNPAQPSKPSLFKLPGSGSHSKLVRIGLIAGGLVVLLILFSIVKGIIIKGPDLSSFIVVAEDQQELIHLVTNATSDNSQQNLSTADQNLAATGQLSLASNQSQVLTYLSNNHQKIKTKTLGLKLNSTLDTELANAQTAGTYDQTFQSVMKDQLGAYLKDLTQAYQSTSSSQQKGRAMLKSFYAQATLLQNQVSSAGD